MKKETSAGAIIFRQNKERKYLLLHYESGHWGYVKGHVEKNENTMETVKREAKEEAGITDLAFVPGFGEEVSYYYKEGESTIFKTVIFLLAETEQEEIRLSSEHIGYKWAGFQNALRQLTYANSKEILQKAESFFKQNKQKTPAAFAKPSKA